MHLKGVAMAMALLLLVAVAAGAGYVAAGFRGSAQLTACERVAGAAARHRVRSAADVTVQVVTVDVGPGFDSDVSRCMADD
jgi:hypothetical protein